VALQVLDHKEHAGAPRPRLRGIGGCSALVPFRSASAQLHRTGARNGFFLFTKTSFSVTVLREPN